MRYFLTPIFLLAILTISAQDIVEVEIENLPERHVWAFYLSFWAGEATWDWNDSVLTDYPLIGRYNSKMPDVAATHIAQAQGAGIDAFVVSWFGLQENVTTTPAFLNLLHRAEEMDFQIAAAVDVFNPAFNRNANDMLESLLWLRNDAISSSAYLRYEGKPVVVFAFQDLAGWDSQTWFDIRNQVDPNREMLWIAEGLSACCLYNGAMDGMYAFNMAWASGNTAFYLAERNLIFQRGGSMYIPSIAPGWDEDTIAAIENRPRPTSRRARADGAFLANAWEAALQTESSIIMVVSWNEFMENSHIEPSVLYGTQSLDILRPLITRWTGQLPQIVAESPSSYAVQVEQLIPAFTFPDGGSDVIAILQPETLYPLVGEESGYYAVAVNGVVAYVSFEYVRFVPE